MPRGKERPLDARSGRGALVVAQGVLASRHRDEGKQLTRTPEREADQEGPAAGVHSYVRQDETTNPTNDPLCARSSLCVVWPLLQVLDDPNAAGAKTAGWRGATEL